MVNLPFTDFLKWKSRNAPW